MFMRRLVPILPLVVALFLPHGRAAAQANPAVAMTQLDRQTRAAAQQVMQQAATEARVPLEGGLLYGSRGDVLVVSTPVQGAGRSRAGAPGDLLFVYVAGADSTVLPAGFYRVRLVPAPGAAPAARSTAQFINAAGRVVAQFPADVRRAAVNPGQPAAPTVKVSLTLELSPDSITIDIEIEITLSVAIRGIPIQRATPVRADSLRAAPGVRSALPPATP